MGGNKKAKGPIVENIIDLDERRENMNLLEVIDKMSREEGFEGVELSDEIGRHIMMTDGEKIELNAKILRYKHILLEDPNFLLSFLCGILHENDHLEQSKSHDSWESYINFLRIKRSRYEQAEKLAEKYAVGELKRRGKDPIVTRAYELVLGMLIGPAIPESDDLDDFLSKYIIKALLQKKLKRSLGYFQRRKAIKLYEQKMKDIVSRHGSNVPSILVKLYS